MPLRPVQNTSPPPATPAWFSEKMHEAAARIFFLQAARFFNMNILIEIRSENAWPPISKQALCLDGTVVA